MKKSTDYVDSNRCAKNEHSQEIRHVVSINLYVVLHINKNLVGIHELLLANRKSCKRSKRIKAWVKKSLSLTRRLQLPIESDRLLAAVDARLTCFRRSSSLCIATCSTRTFTSGNSSKMLLKLEAGSTNKSQTEAARALVILRAFASRQISVLKKA